MSKEEKMPDWYERNGYLQVHRLNPKDLIHNPHVKKLVKALREAAHQGIDFGYGPYESNFVEIAQKALAEFEGEK